MVQGEDITSLAMLSSLQMVGGSLILDSPSDLTSLHGLENLTQIGGFFEITGTGITDLAPLANLTDIDGDPFPGWNLELYVHDNPDLPACWVWQLAGQTGSQCGGDGFPCSGNTGEGSCGTLPEGFQCVPGATGPGVYHGDVSIDAYGHHPTLSELIGVACITGDVWITAPNVTSLAPLSNLQGIGGSLHIVLASSLPNVNGLESLRTVGNTLDIRLNDQLSSLAGLANLTSVHQSPPPPPSFGTPLWIADNPSLPACWVSQLEAQTDLECTGAYPPECSGNNGQGSCPPLPDVDCVPGATGPGVYDGDVYIDPYNPSSPSLEDLEGMICITGTLSIFQRADITSLDALSSLREIGGQLLLGHMPSLTDLSGLENLTSVGSTVYIANNPQLENLAALVEPDQRQPEVRFPFRRAMGRCRSTTTRICPPAGHGSSSCKPGRRARGKGTAATATLARAAAASFPKVSRACPVRRVPASTTAACTSRTPTTSGVCPSWAASPASPARW